ncbi:MAG: hypothetical protein H7Y59_05330 [Anaerolineales bacterium]|nr:hypothetical protein [Anaerolineales bacterium]
MTKARLHPSLLEFSGAMGDMVFKKRNGKLYVSIKPGARTGEPTAAQAVHRERFGEAVAYGKTVMADADIRELYQQAAKQKGTPVFALTVADYLNAPSIKEVDLSAYSGQLNDLIKIKASDDFGVMSVRVTITNAQDNALIESGDAIETGSGSGLWLYSATNAVSNGTDVNISVVATDRPGGTAVDTQSKAI